MTLFDPDAESIGLRAMQYAEPIFNYYNRSTRASVIRIRELLEDWFAAYPNEASEDLRQRFRSPIAGQHRGAFFELYLHRLVTRVGYVVEIHPEIEDEDTHPDFELLKNGMRQFYLEATITADSKEKIAQQQRADQVYDALNRLRSPDFFLTIRVRGAPATPPPGARLRSRLERWLEGMNWDEIAQLCERGGFDALPTFPWEHDGWSLLIQPWPKAPEQRGSQDIRPVALTMPTTVRQLTLNEDIRNAVEVKNKYGELEVPLVVAINVTDEFRPDKTDVMNGLLGQETVIFGPGPARPGPRNPDGAWYGPRGARNTTVSAVLVFPGLTAWNMGQTIPWLVHNPWARVGLPSDALPFPQYVANHEDHTMVDKPGVPPYSFLHLQQPWPPED